VPFTPLMICLVLKAISYSVAFGTEFQININLIIAGFISVVVSNGSRIFFAPLAGDERVTF
jgi:hypothetical protein